MSESQVINRTRRGRGYTFEKLLVDRFNKTQGWQARRLGGSSTGLPDIVAVNAYTLYSIEAKAGTGDMLYVPPDELERCQKICQMFSAYKSREVILAFKFLSKRYRKRSVKGVKSKIEESRALHEYYYKIADIHPDMMIRCDYDGTLHCRFKDGEFARCEAFAVSMPWM